jgi:hypothetical protein
MPGWPKAPHSASPRQTPGCKHLAAEQLRMQVEAATARSSGIVGVDVTVSNHVRGEHATEFLATGTAIRRLADEHKLPETFPKPTFTLGLDS